MSYFIPKRSVVVNGHRTSISLEAKYWLKLKEIASEREMSINDLVSEIDAGRGKRAGELPQNLSAACREEVFDYLVAKINTSAQMIFNLTQAVTTVE